MINLSGRIAIVTGASRGIGRATARMLAGQGATVVAAARGENAGPTVDEIAAAGGQAHLASVDVTDRASIDRMVAEALERFGRIDVLVNNAGIARDQLMLRMKREDWDAVVATNLTAMFSCVQAVLKIRPEAVVHRHGVPNLTLDGDAILMQERVIEGMVLDYNNWQRIFKDL